MAFWGIEVKPGKAVTLYCEKSRGRLRISQAALGFGEATNKSVVQCKVGSRSPMVICVLLPNVTESCHLELELAEVDDVIFSVLGPRSVHLTGYYVHQNPPLVANSDTESYGMDIENSHTDRSTYESDDDNYEDSFIDDDDLQGSPPSPVLNSKGTDEDTPRNDKLKKLKKGHGKKLKKRNQVIESDTDAISNENNDEDGLLLSVSKNKKDVEKTLPKVEEKIADITDEKDDGVKDNGICDDESNEKVDNDRSERESEMQLDDNVTQATDKKDELPANLDTLAETTVNGGKITSDNSAHDNMAETTIINQNLPTSDGTDPMHSPDPVKPKKKRKERSAEKKISDIEIKKDNDVLKEDKGPEVEAPNNMEIAADCLVELGSQKGPKTKKRKKVCHEGTLGDEIVKECQDIPKNINPEQDTLHADGNVNDLPESGEFKEPPKESNIPTESELVNVIQPEKKSKKKTKKKTQGDEDVNTTGVLNVTDNQETVLTKSEVQTTDPVEVQTTDPIPVEKLTLSNGLIIEILSNGPPDGKVAKPGKKVKIYFTGKLKETGQIFDSNRGKKPFKFRLGDDTLIDGWNAGIDGMHVGELRRVIVPPSMGFGSVAQENVPPNSWLIFDIELVGVHK